MHACPPEEVFAPLPADAPQLAAVIGAQKGRDMIVVGPPGTGKSQAIANLIAQCLAQGKTVLFVAEKGVTLDVVHWRLSACRLADAVLELHSSKADKEGMIAQLGRGGCGMQGPKGAGGRFATTSGRPARR